MKTQDSQNLLPTSSQPRTLTVALNNNGRPLGWIERTLLAVDANRVFIEVSDPRLRDELVAANQAEHRDVIAASNSEALLEFMDRLPVPTDCGNDVVIAEEDSSGTRASDLYRRLQARGWSIPVLTVSAQARFAELVGTS